MKVLSHPVCCWLSFSCWEPVRSSQNAANPGSCTFLRCFTASLQHLLLSLNMFREVTRKGQFIICFYWNFAIFIRVLLSLFLIQSSVSINERRFFRFCSCKQCCAYLTLSLCKSFIMALCWLWKSALFKVGTLFLVVLFHDWTLMGWDCLFAVTSLYQILVVPGKTRGHYWLSFTQLCWAQIHRHLCQTLIFYYYIFGKSCE